MSMSIGAGQRRLWAAIGLLACLWTLPGCNTLPMADADGSDGLSAQADGEARRRARIRLELAASYLQRGQPEVALEEVRQALVIDPGYADAYHLRGLVFMAQGDLALAEGSLRRAQGIKPQGRTSCTTWAGCNASVSNTRRPSSCLSVPWRSPVMPRAARRCCRKACANNVPARPSRPKKPCSALMRSTRATPWWATTWRRCCLPVAKPGARSFMCAG